MQNRKYEWVQVSKDKPEMGEDVWVWDGQQVRKDRMLGGYMWVSQIFNGKKVTHWAYMQKPEPPTVKKEESEEHKCNCGEACKCVKPKAYTNKKCVIRNGFLFTASGSAYALGDISYVRYIQESEREYAEAECELVMKSNPSMSFYMSAEQAQEVLALLGE